jgi:hypothetical protein
MWIRLVIVLAATTILLSGAILQHHVKGLREQNGNRPTVNSPNYDSGRAAELTRFTALVSNDGD